MSVRRSLHQATRPGAGPESFASPWSPGSAPRSRRGDLQEGRAEGPPADGEGHRRDAIRRHSPPRQELTSGGGVSRAVFCIMERGPQSRTGGIFAGALPHSAARRQAWATHPPASRPRCARSTEHCGLAKATVGRFLSRPRLHHLPTVCFSTNTLRRTEWLVTIFSCSRTARSKRHTTGA